MRLLEDLFNRPRDYADVLPVLAALHGEGLAAPRLAVGEDANVIAVDGALDQLADLVENRLLRSLLSKHFVEIKVELFRTMVRWTL